MMTTTSIYFAFISETKKSFFYGIENCSPAISNRSDSERKSDGQRKVKQSLLQTSQAALMRGGKSQLETCRIA